jgi:hypothetical protein
MLFHEVPITFAQLFTVLAGIFEFCLQYLGVWAVSVVCSFTSIKNRKLHYKL